MNIKLIREEKANALIENVIILPLILFVIFFMILASFIVHDRATLDAAVSRGAVYATKCIADPFYSRLISDNNTSAGSLDATISDPSSIVFKTKKSITDTSGIGINPYRYLTSSYKKTISDTVKTEVVNIVNATKIPWQKIPTDNIKCEVKNYVVYQKVTVTAKSEYPLPAFFKTIGLPDKIEYSATAVASVTDPDELIRNADLVVDLMVQSGLTNKLAGVKSKLDTLVDKIKNSPISKFFKVN